MHLSDYWYKKILNTANKLTQLSAREEEILDDNFSLEIDAKALAGIMGVILSVGKSSKFLAIAKVSTLLK